MSQSQPMPILLPSLRLALASLYSLSHSAGPSTAERQREAHDFLLRFQGRNVRRRHRSRAQRRRDIASSPRGRGGAASACDDGAEDDAEYDEEDGGGGTSDDSDDAGSTWLACLALSAVPDAHPTERLFAAQTMHHRLRRMRPSEAIDVEAESGTRGIAVLDAGSDDPGVVAAWVDAYVSAVGGYHPLLRATLERCVGTVRASLAASTAASSTTDPTASRRVGLEERIKCELCVPTLSAFAYLASFEDRASVSRNPGASPAAAAVPDRAGPLLDNLGAAVATTVLRLRYSPESIEGGNALPHPPLVTLASNAVQIASDAALPLHRAHAAHASSSRRVLCSTLGALPDVLLGSSGGARGRLSVDRRCVRAANAEFRHMETGTDLLLEALGSCWGGRRGGGEDRTEDDQVLHGYVLEACERWAKFVPVGIAFVERTVPLAAQYACPVVRQHQQCQPSPMATRRAAFAYLLAIYEAAALNVEQILAASVGMTTDASGGATHQNPARKKMSSKAKKRHKERLQSAVNEGGEVDAKREKMDRGDAACHAAALSWEGMQAALEEDLAAVDVCAGNSSGEGGSLDEQVDGEVYGEGAVGCLCACAAACLPHLVRRGGGAENEAWQCKDLFESIRRAFERLCSCRNRSVRALTYEPIMSLHATLMKEFYARPGTTTELEQIAIGTLFTCTMILASKCGYPQGYFDDLSADNDEDLEIERNDVRDVIRSVTSLENADRSADIFDGVAQNPRTYLSSPSVVILDRVVRSCAEAVSTRSDASHPHTLPPETVVHVLSALAKPLNKMAELLVQIGGDRVDIDIVSVALRALADVLSQLVDAFTNAAPLSNLIPVSRLALLGISSFTPLFSSLCTLSPRKGEFGAAGQQLIHIFETTLRLSIQTAALSVARIPELVSESSLGRSVYDIRGAMRGPGGEDHVGCIALLRMSFESDDLARKMMQVVDASTGASTPFVLDLCEVHRDLKQAELAREPGVLHGPGVAPKSRRVLLNTISRLGLVAIEEARRQQNSTLENQLSSRLNDLMHSSLEVIRSSDGNDAGQIFCVCEATFDLASFSANLIRPLFFHDNHQVGSVALEGIRTLVGCGLSGYHRLKTVHGIVPDMFCQQWGRMRGALVALFRSSINNGMPPLALDAIISLIKTEGGAAVQQCSAGPDSPSNLFVEPVIGDDVLPAGAFITVLDGALSDMVSHERGHHGIVNEQVMQPFGGCIRAFCESKESVLDLILHQSPEAIGHVDPRPTLAEAWYLSMNSLVLQCKRGGAWAEFVQSDPNIKSLLSDSCAAVISLLLLRRLDKDTAKDNRIDVPQAGMSLDGPQTLAMIDYLDGAFSLGPEIMLLTSHALVNQFDLDLRSIESNGSSLPSADMAGGALIGAALLRASSGGLPPWAIEGLPKVFSSLFQACGNSSDNFLRVISASTEVKLSNNPGRTFGGLLPGERIAGRFFDKMSGKSRVDFLKKTNEVCTANDWRRFKVVLKQASGGKKKDSGFNLKPTFTSWECERI